MNLVTRIEFGSHLYGTSTPESDHDYKSVYLPSASDILLQRVKASTGHIVKREEGKKNAPGDTNDEAYSLQRYLQLLAEGQTVAIDMLFAPSPLITTPLWEKIKANKDRLLTTKSAAFVGYCRTQANKYGIKGSRVAAAKKAAEFFEVWAKQLAQGSHLLEVADLLSGLCIDEHTQIVTLETTPGRTETFFECCNRKVSFGNTVKAAHEIFAKIYAVYGERARLAETNAGIDWKALSHAVRVGWEARELLLTGNITFPLPNALHVLDIKLGRLPYQSVADEIEELLVEIERASTMSTLRDEADTKWIDALVINEHCAVVRRMDTQPW